MHEEASIPLASGWFRDTESTQLSSPHASPLAFPTLGYSGPLCHCGGFHSATTQIKPEREKHERLKLQARMGGDALFTVCLVFSVPLTIQFFKLIYGTVASPTQRHWAAIDNNVGWRNTGTHV